MCSTRKDGAVSIVNKEVDAVFKKYCNNGRIFPNGVKYSILHIYGEKIDCVSFFSIGK
jgi:hypothetical protein